jgi:predicted enzyme related to lactoylglutathione lyase
MVYFAVEDCDTSMAAAEGLGGEVFLPAMEMGPGKFGGLIDPTGGMFLLGSF